VNVRTRVRGAGRRAPRSRRRGRGRRLVTGRRGPRSAPPPSTGVLVEIIDAPTDAPTDAATADADAVLAALDAAGSTAPRLLHGENAACWPLVRHAACLGLPTRIGLEDTLVGPDGEPVRDNADLVGHALRILTAR
jgi:uncharacterized protein (DUF849 family)